MTNYNVFAEHFKGYKDNYVIIGGTACELIMKDIGVAFRATSDIDMIIVAEELTADFGKAFWQFIQDGGYESHKDNVGKNYYRFSKPSTPGYPIMLELFCRKPIEDYRTGNLTFMPIHISDEIKSLSAIVLNDAYAEVLAEGKQLLDNMTILGPEFIIIFKTRAHIDLKERKRQGQQVKTEDIMKHLKDIIRMLTILDIDESKEKVKTISDEIKQDLQLLITEIDKVERTYIRNLREKDGLLNNADLVIKLLNELFDLGFEHVEVE